MNKKTTLELVDGGSGMCGGGSCPAVYKDSNGRIYIQGTKLDTDLRKGITVAESEGVVEVSPEMLDALKKL